MNNKRGRDRANHKCMLIASTIATMFLMAGFFAVYSAPVVNANDGGGGQPDVFIDKNGNCTWDSGEDAFYGTHAIQTAIDNATDGDTIIVNAGTYTESITINKSINLVGKPGAIIKCPSSPEDVYIQESDHHFEYVIAVLGGTYNSTNDTVYGPGTIHVNISGFEIDGSNAGTTDHYFAGIFIRNAIGNISNNYIHDMYGPSGNGSGEQTFGILAYGNSDLTVYNNTVKDFSRGGIVANGDLGGLPDPVANIESNVVIGNGLESATNWRAENGIQIGWGASGTVKENEVYDCMCNDPSWASSGIIIQELKMLLWKIMMSTVTMVVSLRLDMKIIRMHHAITLPLKIIKCIQM